MSAGSLSAAESRSLLALVDVALEQRDPPEFLRAQAPALTCAALRASALAAADALAAGEPPSRALARLPVTARAALEVGERVGEPERGVERALASLDLASRSKGSLLAPLVQPLLGLSLGVLSASLAAGLGAPAVFELSREMAGGFGGVEPGAALAFLAAHSRGVLVAGALLAFLVLTMVPLVALMAATRRGSAVLLLVPVVGTMLRARASAEHAGALATLLAARAPANVAHAAAAATVSVPALRARLERETPRVAAGDPVDDVLRAAGLPLVGGLLRLHGGDADGGVAACVAARVHAEELCEQAARRLGRVLAATAIGATASLALALLATLVLPLLAIGGGA